MNIFPKTANYPETLKACYFINASKVFHLLFRIVKVKYNHECKDHKQLTYY